MVVTSDWIDIFVAPFCSIREQQSNQQHVTMNCATKMLGREEGRMDNLWPFEMEKTTTKSLQLGSEFGPAAAAMAAI
jgi:hypothetical protein